jgi:hypothetical protein
MSVGSFAVPKIGSPANVLREYTTGGSWSKPTDASFTGVWVFAAGGGGSAGAGGSTLSPSGGSGGGGGAIVRLWIPAASLAVTETYAIGAGGSGVATGNGGAGGATLFGLHVEAKGGSGGNQGGIGSPNAVRGGNALLCVPVTGSAISGGPSARGRVNTLQTDASSAVIGSILTLTGVVGTFPVAVGGAGGGGGGGDNNTTATGIGGSDGGGCYQGGSLTAGPAGGAFGGGNGTAGTNDIYIDPFLGIVTTTIGLGTGGSGGGGASGATAGGTGGAGGRGAGGGGGGGAQTSGTRGASGAGGNGFLLVYEVFAI